MGVGITAMYHEARTSSRKRGGGDAGKVSYGGYGVEARFFDSYVGRNRARFLRKWVEFNGSAN